MCPSQLIHCAQILRRLGSAAVLLAMAACSSADGAGSDRDPLRWSWLAGNGGTYWYVPTENLLAYGWQTDSPRATQSLDDQTVWYIDRYENGYIFGKVVAEFVGHPPQCQYMIGSVTPSGQVYITFNSLQERPVGSPSLTTGFGQMVRADGDWAFSMQMASGSSSLQVTHWAYMLQCTQSERCWTHLPGVDKSIDELLAACPTT
jgi:hypothetical protein